MESTGPRSHAGSLGARGFDVKLDFWDSRLKRIRERLRLVRDAYRWRGPSIFFLMVLREILSPIMYWHVFHVFETGIQPPSDSSAAAKFGLRLYAGDENRGRVIREITSMGKLAAHHVEARLDRGEAVAVAYARGEAVGYSWISFSSECDLVWGIRCTVRPDEAVFYDSFVLPHWRGRGVHRFLDAALTRYARQRGCRTTLGWVSALNTPSLSLVRHHHKVKIMTLVLVHFRGVNWNYRKAVGAPLASRFFVSGDSPAVRQEVPTGPSV